MKFDLTDFISKFNNKFGYAGPEKNCDSFIRPAGCDDCPHNIEEREEYFQFFVNYLKNLKN